MEQSILDKLNWRYATKKFDPNKNLPEKYLNILLESLRLSASSFGLQPWKFVHIRNKDLRAKLKEPAWDQAQIIDASDLIVFCGLKNLNKNYVEKFIAQVARVRGVDFSSLDGYKKIMVDFVEGLSSEQLEAWISKQVHIALGNLLTICALNNIDACPMEGFDPVKFDEVLGLEKNGITSKVLCTIGYRSKQDQYATLKKVRFSKEEVVIE